ESGFDFMPLIDAGTVQGHQAGSAASKLSDTAVLLIAEPALAILTILDITRAAIHGRFRHIKARIARRPQRHDLANRHGHICVPARGLVAPPPFRILVVDDELDGSLDGVAESLAQVLVVHHPMD